MASGTAASTITIGGMGTGDIWPEASADVIERYNRIWRPRKAWVPSDGLLAAQIAGPEPLLPNWLGGVEELVQHSTAIEPEPLNDGRWLTQRVVEAAQEFFRNTADLLPVEPRVYSSSQGDLVAEFDTPHGCLTCIVSPEFVVLFTVINGTPSYNVVHDREAVRAELEGALKSLLAG